MISIRQLQVKAHSHTALKARQTPHHAACRRSVSCADRAYTLTLLFVIIIAVVNITTEADFNLIASDGF